MDVQKTVLLCPRNDEESLQILKIAKAAGIQTIVSKQPHGARLERERRLLAQVKHQFPDATDIVIVEIPGPIIEEELREAGLNVHLIDHHRYDDLNRMQETSSLEQFLAFFNILDEQLATWGFDPRMVAAVGALDRGFIWELKQSGFEGDEFKQAIDYYRSLKMQLGEERIEREEAAAASAWERREMKDSILIIRAPYNEPSVRDALSYLVAKEYPDTPPQTFIIQGNRRMYVQETPHAEALSKRFGGFTFGRDLCWGILKEDGDLPKEEDILSIISSS